MSAPFGNQLALKYKTPEERKRICDLFCEHIAQGFNKDFFPECDYDTICSYVDRFPDDFPIEKIKEAERIGMKKLEQTGYAGMLGKIPGFNVTAWIFIVKNKLRWTDRAEHTLQGKDGQPIKFNIIAGEGFLPPAVTPSSISEGSIVEGPTPIQGTSVASESKENVYLDNGISQAGTA